MSTLVQIQAAALPSSATVMGFHAREAISELYAVDVVLRVTSGAVEPDAAVDASATFFVPCPTAATPRRWSGVISAIELAHATDEVEYWRVTISPKLWRLTQTFHSRVFVDKSVPEIVAAVLALEGLSPAEFQLALSGDYPTLEHVTQFRESSYDFICRLMEREGIHFSFDHRGDDELLMIVDDPSAALPARAAPIAYRPLGGEVHRGPEGLHVLSYAHRAIPKEVRVTDYDYLRPSSSIRASSPMQAKMSAPHGVIVEHAEFVPAPGQEARYARIRAEEIAATEHVFQGKGRFHELRAGTTFEVTEHPDARFATEYLATRAELRGSEVTDGELAALLGLGEDGVRTTFTAIPAITPFRAPRLAPWPRIHGVVDGVVDGAASSEYAQLDSHGRYKVKLRFDESDGAGGASSTWVRMLQPHGGGTEGFHFPLRKQTEVQVSFLGGDPDRPVIVAVAPNAIERSVITAANHTSNVIHTGGDNKITMEDAGGGQYVTSFTPTAATKLHLGAGGNQIELRTDGQGHVHIGQNLDVDVHAAKIETVTGSLTETYVGFQKLDVAVAVTRTFSTLQDQTVGGPVTEIVTGALTETVGAAVDELYQSGQKTTVDGAVTLTYGATLDHTVNGGLHVEAITGPRTRSVAATWNHRVSGHVEETLGATKRNVTGDYTETVGGTLTIEAPSMKVYAAERGWLDTTINLVEAGKKINDALNFNLGDNVLSIAGMRNSASGASVTLTGTRNAKGTFKNCTAALEKDLAFSKKDVFSIGLIRHGVYMKIAGILIFQ